MVMNTIKSKFRKYLLTSILILLILLSFFIRIPTIESQVWITFSIDNDQRRFRVGYPVTFTYVIVANPAQIVVTWGDGNIETITGAICQKNGKFYGKINHSYAIQGKYSPQLVLWSPLGKEYSESTYVIIQNDILPFDVNINGTQIFEDQEVFIDVGSVINLNSEIEQEYENLTYLYDLTDAQITSNESSLTHSWKNMGSYPIRVSVVDGQGTISRACHFIEVVNTPPKANFSILGNGNYDTYTVIEASAENCNDTVSDRNSLRYIWDWGDNSAAWGKYTSHQYSTPGEYNITLYVIDNNGASDIYYQLINISKGIETKSSSSATDMNDPYVTMGTFPDTVFEDDIVQFTGEIVLQEGNLSEYRFEWVFGDDIHSFERAPQHAWAKAGLYEIVLNVSDSNGNEYIRTREITVKEKAPDVLGPFSFQGIEGQSVTLDIEIYDALDDEPDLKYEWFDDNNNLFSTNKSPSIVLDDGNYKYTLNVTDSSGEVSSNTIDINIYPYSPEIFIPNYIYYGEGAGLITLRAYSQDCAFDTSELEFDWIIKNGRNAYHIPDNYNGEYSEIFFECAETAIYQGEVIVVDASGKTKVGTFEIFSCVNSPQNLYNNNELQEFLGLKPGVSLESTPDTDGDNLSDAYESQISNTSIFNPDTDRDGLYDGYNELGIGELTLGTSPTDFDSDDDGLGDGQEYFGYEISIIYFENESRLHVSSDPLNADSDADGVP
ncbi:MAG: PKD domain-containing protein, partial [Promethearchaeota archaeon]